MLCIVELESVEPCEDMVAFDRSLAIALRLVDEDIRGGMPFASFDPVLLSAEPPS